MGLKELMCVLVILIIIVYIVLMPLGEHNEIRHSIVASIPACHAGDQGSIPCDGEIYFGTQIFTDHQILFISLQSFSIY